MKLPFQQFGFAQNEKHKNNHLGFHIPKNWLIFKQFSLNTNLLFLKSEYYLCISYGPKGIRYMSEEHQMSSDDSNSTNMTMELIPYWSFFIGVFLW